jgi:hypothetical protein
MINVPVRKTLTVDPLSVVRNPFEMSNVDALDPVSPPIYSLPLSHTAILYFSPGDFSPVAHSPLVILISPDSTAISVLIVPPSPFNISVALPDGKTRPLEHGHSDGHE